MRWSKRVLELVSRSVLRVEVAGPSMLPTLAPGERLLVHRTQRVRVGDVVVVLDPCGGDEMLIKRLAATDGEMMVLAGDNFRVSRDSSDFGPVPRALLVGRAWYRYFPAEASRRLRRH